MRGQEAPEPHKGPHHQYAHFHAAKSSQIRIENDPVTAQDHDSKQGAFCLGWNLLGRVGWPRVPIEPGCPVPRLVSHTEILGEGSGKVAWQVPSERIESEMYGLGHHVLARGRVQAGETAVILGAGKLGLSVLDVLCHGSGACLTMVCDVQPLRLNVAGKLGADHVVDVAQEDPVARVREWTGGVGADCVIECVGHYHDVAGREAPLAQAVKMIRPGGRVVTAGMGERLSAVHFKTLVVKEAEIIATRVTAGEFPRAIRLLDKGLLHPELLVTRQLPLREVQAGFAAVDGEEPGTIKVVLDVQAT